MSGLRPLEAASNLPLLSDGQDIVYQPVKNQTRREEEEKDAAHQTDQA
jgi:hypothetical protein